MTTTAGLSVPGATPGVVITHVSLIGTTTVTADVPAPTWGDPRVIRVNLGESLVLTMDLDTADSLADALCEAAAEYTAMPPVVLTAESVTRW